MNTSEAIAAIVAAVESRGQPAMLHAAPYVMINLAAVMFGLTEKAIRNKIADGVWVEGREYRRAPDGRIYISVKGVTAWVEQGASRSARTQSASRSRSRVSSTTGQSSSTAHH